MPAGATRLTLGQVKPVLKGIRRSRAGYTALCPVASHHDTRNSLSVSKGRDGQLLVTCHKGCTYPEIVSALSSALSDSAPPQRSSGSGKQVGSQLGEVVATYEYRDENGQILFRTLWYEPKDFRVQSPDGKGGWRFGLGGVRRILYRLPQLRHAIEADRWVLYVEGEKDADTAHSYGLTATTHQGGAKGWRPGYADALSNATVVIVPDNDKPGWELASDVAAGLDGVAADVRVLHLPGLPEKGDLTDWFCDGHSAAELTAAVENLLAGAPRAPASNAVEIRNRTDLGNARRLVALFGERIRYVPAWGKWLVYTGGRWARDESGEVSRLAKKTALSIHEEAKAATDYVERKLLSEHALRSESKSRIEAMVALAQTEPNIPVMPDELDADPWLLNAGNGTIDLRTGTLLPHAASDLLTKQVPVRYDAEAPAPQFDAFLKEVLGASDELVAFFQRAVGYALTGSCREQKLFMLWGSGANGKSTAIELIHSTLGDYATRADYSTFLASNTEKQKNDLARLCGARFVSASEAGEGRRIDEPLIKGITGGDTQVGRYLYHESFEFTPQFKLWLASNHKPTVRGADLAMWRRILLIPFTVTIPEERRDASLLDKLKAESAGVLRWLVQGCLAWQREGLSPPAAVVEATAEYREESDVLGLFLDECCERGDGFSEEAKRLYDAYKAWATERSETPLTWASFGRRLGEDKGIPSTKGAKGRKAKVRRLGVRLLDDLEPTFGGHGDSGGQFNQKSPREGSIGGIARNPVQTVPNRPPRRQLAVAGVRPADPTASDDDVEELAFGKRAS